MAKYFRQLNLSAEEHKKFTEVVVKELQVRGISIPQLAEKINYSRKSVWQFLNDESIVNKYLAASIEDYLKIKWR